MARQYWEEYTLFSVTTHQFNFNSKFCSCITIVNVRLSEGSLVSIKIIFDWRLKLEVEIELYAVWPIPQAIDVIIDTIEMQ